MAGYASQFEHIAVELDALAEKNFAKPRHLSNRLNDLRLQALQLMWSALRGGLFPEFQHYLETRAGWLANLEAAATLKEGIRPLLAEYPPLIAKAPDWTDPIRIWVQAVRGFVGQRLPGRLPDNPNVSRSDQRAGLYALHYEPDLWRIETHPPGTALDPRLAKYWREQGFPENTKGIHRNSISVEGSYDEADWMDRLQREAKSDAAICLAFAEMASPEDGRAPADVTVAPNGVSVSGEGRAGAQGKPHGPAWGRLQIVKSDTGNDLARLDGKEYRLTGANDKTFLEQLQKKHGETMLGATLEALCSERPARIYKRLPKPIQRIIDNPGQRTGKKGYRML